MKKALISPNESVSYISAWDSAGCVWSEITGGQRVAEVHPLGFDVAQPLFWVDCTDEVSCEGWYWDSNSKTLTQKPADVPGPTVDALSIPAAADQPAASGAQTL